MFGDRENERVFFLFFFTCTTELYQSDQIKKKKKKTAEALKYMNNWKSRHQNYVQIFTDGSKVDEKIAAAAASVAPNSPLSCRLRDHCSIYTAVI